MIFNIPSVRAVFSIPSHPLCRGSAQVLQEPAHFSFPLVPFSNSPSVILFFRSQDHAYRCCFRRSRLQMILANASPLWIMHWDYIKTSWRKWSIFNPDDLLVWSSPWVCARVSVSVCLCVQMNMSETEIKKRNRAKVRLSFLFSPCLSVEFNSDRLYWHGI